MLASMSCGLRRVLVALTVLLPAGASAALPDGISLQAPIARGQLIVASVDPAAVVSVNRRNVRVDSEGRFVFGIGRDDERLAICIRTGNDRRARCGSVAVPGRSYRIERVDGLPPSTVNPDPAEQARIANEAALIASARERDDARSDFAVAFKTPARGRISGVYGSQRILNGAPRSPHMGLDIAAPVGTPIVAPAPGVVTLVHQDMLLTGKTVILDHGHGVSSVFIHMSRIDVALGDVLDIGDPLGAIGATGRASGPHLHWGLNWFDVKLDPALVVDLP
jgi:murein DD-endopeptidase MepM/ murein hydrolase activator NlpD